MATTSRPSVTLILPDSPGTPIGSSSVYASPDTDRSHATGGEEDIKENTGIVMRRQSLRNAARRKLRTPHRVATAGGPVCNITNVPVPTQFSSTAASKPEDPSAFLSFLNGLEPSSSKAARSSPKRPAVDPRAYDLLLSRLTDIESQLAASKVRERLAASSHEVSTDVSSDVAVEAHWHDAYGRLVHDFGNKKLYVASAAAFVENVPIWVRQRAADASRIAEIARHARAKLDGGSTQQPRVMGTISVFDYGDEVSASLSVPQPRAVFDGQHRVWALSELLKGGDPVDDFDIAVEVYPVTCEAEAVDLFVAINKAEPVQEIDLPEAIATMTKVCIDEAVDALAAAYPAMFKPSMRCRPPHVNRDVVRNALFHGDVLRRLGVTDAQGLVDAIEGLNTSLGDRARTDWAPKLRKHHKKAAKNGFYLGLCPGWVDLLAP